jgi:hypothetical protein
MRAEDAAVHVRLVDDHVAEVREDVAPAVVVGEDADVEHVRVGEDHVRPLADLPASLALRVAVVDRRLDALDAEGGQRPRLVLRERLRRVEVERAALRLPREQVEHREGEREALPARRARGHDRVATAAERLPCLGLVAVEGGDAVGDQRRGDAGIEVVRERLAAPRPGRLDRQVRELLAREHVRPRGGCSGLLHGGSVATCRTGSGLQSIARPTRPGQEVRPCPSSFVPSAAATATSSRSS